MAPSIQGPGSLACPIRFCTICKDGSSDTGPAQSSISARRYNRRFCRCSWYQSKDNVFLAPDTTNKGSAHSLHKLQRAKVYFFYCYHVRALHIIISHKRCINSRFCILYTYFRSSYCRLCVCVTLSGDFASGESCRRSVCVCHSVRRLCLCESCRLSVCVSLCPATLPLASLVGDVCVYVCKNSVMVYIILHR